MKQNNNIKPCIKGVLSLVVASSLMSSFSSVAIAQEGSMEQKEVFAASKKHLKDKAPVQELELRKQKMELLRDIALAQDECEKAGGICTDSGSPAVAPPEVVRPKVIEPPRFTQPQSFRPNVRLMAIHGGEAKVSVNGRVGEYKRGDTIPGVGELSRIDPTHIHVMINGVRSKFELSWDKPQRRNQGPVGFVPGAVPLQ